MAIVTIRYCRCQKKMSRSCEIFVSHINLTVLGFAVTRLQAPSDCIHMVKRKNINIW